MIKMSMDLFLFAIAINAGGSLKENLIGLVIVHCVFLMFHWTYK